MKSHLLTVLLFLMGSNCVGSKNLESNELPRFFSDSVFMRGFGKPRNNLVIDKNPSEPDVQDDITADKFFGPVRGSPASEENEEKAPKIQEEKIPNTRVVLRDLNNKVVDYIAHKAHTAFKHIRAHKLFLLNLLMPILVRIIYGFSPFLGRYVEAWLMNIVSDDDDDTPEDTPVAENRSDNFVQGRGEDPNDAFVVFGTEINNDKIRMAQKLLIDSFQVYSAWQDSFANKK